MLPFFALTIAHAADLIPTPGNIDRITSGDRLTQIQVPYNGLTTILSGVWNKGLEFFFAFVAMCAIWQIIGIANGYAMSGGDPKKIETLQRGLVQTVMGVAIIVSSTLIVALILSAIRYLAATTS